MSVHLSQPLDPDLSEDCRVGGLPVVDDELQSSRSQIEGEALQNDENWTRGCWIFSYLRFHNFLVEQARSVANERQEAQQESQRAAGQADATIADSVELLKKQVFALCPMQYLISGIGISFVLTIVSFITPYVQGRLVDVSVDEYHQHKHGEDVNVAEIILPYLILYAALSFTSYACQILVGILFAISGHTTVTRLRIKLFKNLTIQEIAFYDAHVSGELSSRLINDSASLSSLVQFTTQTLLGAVVKFVGSLVAMFATHPMLALIATVVTPVNTFLVRATGKTVGHYGVVQNHAMAKANAIAVEVLGSIRSVQSNCGEVHEANVFMQKLNYFLRVIKATVYLETVLRFTFYGLSRTRDIVVLGVAMHQVILGQMSIGSYTAFAQYVVLYEDGFKDLAETWINFRQTITSTGNFVQLLLRTSEIQLEGGRKLETCVGMIKFEDVSFEYKARAGHMVLKKFNLKVVPGNIIALVGESGAGKSTVGRLLQRFYDPTDGHILLDDVNFKDLDLRWLRSQIGTVEQEPVLFDRPIFENIAYGSARGKPMQDIEEAARLANADQFIMELQNSYHTNPGERAARISGGQKQRVAIARAIIRNPKVLLLDEATSALDAENEDVVQKALDKMMVEKTTFIIAHRLSTIVRATKIVVLDKGSVIEEGDHVELSANGDSKYNAFMKHQQIAPLLK